MIEIKKVEIDYKTIKMSFDNIIIKDNRVTVIEGKNGSGKTTLLRAMSGLIPFTGSIRLDGDITYNSQEPVIFDRTVLENIMYPLRIRKLNVEDYLDEINKYSDMLELTPLLEENGKNLSSGEKMKVSIIRSVIFKPKYVLLDEPTTHLDIESIDELINLIRRLKNEITFIIVSHNKQFITELFDDKIKLGGNHVYRKNNWWNKANNQKQF